MLPLPHILPRHVSLPLAPATLAVEQVLAAPAQRAADVVRLGLLPGRAARVPGLLGDRVLLVAAPVADADDLVPVAAARDDLRVAPSPGYRVAAADPLARPDAREREGRLVRDGDFLAVLHAAFAAVAVYAILRGGSKSAEVVQGGADREKECWTYRELFVTPPFARAAVSLLLDGSPRLADRTLPGKESVWVIVLDFLTQSNR